MSNSLQAHGLQHARLPCPSLSPRVCSHLCPSSQWCHPAIWSSVTAFSSFPQSFPASGSFPVSWLFPSRGQSVRASASVLSVNIQGWFLSGLTPRLDLLVVQRDWSIPAFSKGIFKDFGANKLFSIPREWPLVSNTTGGLSGKPDYSLHLLRCTSCCMTQALTRICSPKTSQFKYYPRRRLPMESPFAYFSLFFPLRTPKCIISPYALVPCWGIQGFF